MPNEPEKIETAEKTEEKEPLFIPTLALALDMLCLVSIGLAALFLYLNWDFLSFLLFLPFAFAAIVLPFIAVALGIAGLCMYKRVGKMGIAFSIVAIVLPALIVLVVFILGANGIPLIRFM